MRRGVKTNWEVMKTVKAKCEEVYWKCGDEWDKGGEAGEHHRIRSDVEGHYGLTFFAAVL